MDLFSILTLIGGLALFLYGMNAMGDGLANYRRIKEEVKQIVQDELERIAGDDNLKHLLQQK